MLKRLIRNARDSARQWHVRRGVMSTNQALAWNRHHAIQSVLLGMLTGWWMTFTGER